MHLKRLSVCWILATLFPVSALFWQSLAQEFDTVISSRNRRAYTLADQIEDPVERQTLVALFAQPNPGERARLAEQFLKNYPRSWFLPQVYEMAAKAFIDLGDFARALDYGRQSLRLLPENPLLLVPLANVQVQQSRFEEARISARFALDYLEQFAPPLSISPAEWPAIQRQLKASSYFALGRASVTEALSLSPGEKRRTLLLAAEHLLQQARELHSQDAEICYLLGLAQLPGGKKEDAALSFAAAHALGGSLQAKALDQLQRLHQQQSKSGSAAGFERFFEELQAKLRRLKVPASSAPASAVSSATAPPHYAGSQACRQCHAGQHQDWQQTGMARMLRPYRAENVIGDFDSDQPFYAGDDIRWRGQTGGAFGSGPAPGAQLEVVPGKDRFVYARMFKEGGRHYFQIRQSGGQWIRYPVDFTIGSKWQQAYATRLPNGQIHVFPIQYNAIHRRWLNFWKVIDPEGSERADVRTFEKFSATTSYQANCAVCHTSQLRNTQGGGFEADHLEFREPGVNCEMCHGPSAQHVEAMRLGKPYNKLAADPPVDFTGISSRQYLEICGQCHRQSAMRDPGPNGELNYSPGTPFYPQNKSRPYGEFSRKAFYKDGRFRETTFIVESLRRSACFQKGQANCGHCHDVHGEKAEANPKSLRFRQEPDRMCLQCHAQMGSRIESHTRHPAKSEASRCVACHMPPIMNSLLFRARTHQIDDIPNAAMLERFGPEESPNACLLCHDQKDTAWLSAELRKR